MGLNYHNLKKHPRNFRDITGLKVEGFEKIVEKVRPEWKKNEKTSRIQRPKDSKKQKKSYSGKKKTTTSR